MPLSPTFRQPALAAASPRAGYSSAKPHLTNDGGPVLKHPQVVPLFYGKYWGTSAGKADRQYLDGFDSALVNNKGYAGVLGQYGVGKASVKPSSRFEAGAAPKQVTDSQVVGQLKNAIARGKLKPSNNSLLTVYLPPGTTAYINGVGKEGGYHGSFIGPKGQTVHYAVVAYDCGGTDKAGTPNARANTTIAASHEYAEAATDPDIQQGKTGWYDNSLAYTLKGKSTIAGEEIGDISTVLSAVQKHYAQPYGGLSSKFGISGGYSYEDLWSNRDGRDEIAPKK